MVRMKWLVICLVGTLIFSGARSLSGTAAAETAPYQIFLPLVSNLSSENRLTASGDFYSTNADTLLVVPAPGVLGNDSSVDGSPLTAVWVSDPAHGNLTLYANGSFTYMPESGYTGSDSFTYKASDGLLESNTATVTLTINEVSPSCSTAPILISPGDGITANTLIPTFQWDNGNKTDITEVHLFISLQEDDYQNTWVYWVTSYNSYFEEERYDFENLDPGTTYYWQVWLTCGEIESPHSAVWSFNTGTGGTILPAPTLLSPANGSDIWSEDLPVVLKWSALSGADEYKVYLSKWLDGSWYLVWSTVVSETQAVIPNILTAYSFYRWLVLPMNYYAIGTPSEAWIFETHD